MQCALFKKIFAKIFLSGTQGSVMVSLQIPFSVALVIVVEVQLLSYNLHESSVGEAYHC